MAFENFKKWELGIDQNATIEKGQPMSSLNAKLAKKWDIKFEFKQ